MIHPFPQQTNNKETMRDYNSKHLQRASDADVRYVISKKDVVERNRLLSRNHRESRQGMTKDRSMKFIGSFDIKVLFHPELSKYFDPKMDKREAKKHIYRFLQLHPEYRVS